MNKHIKNVKYKILGNIKPNTLLVKVGRNGKSQVVNIRRGQWTVEL
jgi:hypothetical protein